MIFIFGFFAVFLFFWVLFIPLGPLIQHTLAALGKKTASFRYGDYLPVAVVLLLGVLASAFAGDQFVDLAELVQAESPVLQHADTSIHEWARQQRSAGATVFFTAFTLLGTPVGLGIIVIIVAAALWFRERRRWAVYLLVTTTIGALLVVELKVFFSRARPDLAVALRTAHGYSFPSGHAMGTTVVFGALSYLILRAKRSWRMRAAGLAGSAAIVTAVSMSRVYLGVHWISDIAAGLAAGSLWVVAATVAYETSRRIRLIRSLRRQRATE